MQFNYLHGVAAPPPTDNTAPLWATAATLTVVDGGTNDEKDLSWPAASDDVAVTGYRIYRVNGDATFTMVVDVGNVLAYTLTGLIAAGIGEYRIRAYDAAGNESDPFSSTAPAAVIGAGGFEMITGEQAYDGHTVVGGPSAGLVIQASRISGGSTAGTGGNSDVFQSSATRSNSPTFDRFSFSRPITSAIIEIRNHNNFTSFNRHERLLNFKIDGADYEPSIIYPSNYSTISNPQGWGPPQTATDGSTNWVIDATSLKPDGNAATQAAGYFLVFESGTGFSDIDISFQVYNTSGTNNQMGAIFYGTQIGWIE